MSVSSIARPRFSDREPSLDTDGQQRTRAILTGARSVIGRGWLQGGWYVLEAPSGRRRFVGAGSLTPRGYGMVVRACLVGAVVEAATWHSPQRGIAGPALDALWSALQDAEGRYPDPVRRSASPAVLGGRVRDLTRWNDHPERSQDDVLRLFDATIGRVVAETSTPT